MPAIRRQLARSAQDAWLIAFDRDELHLRIEHTDPSGRSTPRDWQMLEDFLVRLPNDETHARARDRVICLIEEFMKNVKDATEEEDDRKQRKSPPPPERRRA